MKIFNVCSAMAICFALSIMGCKAPSTETAAAAEAVDTMAVAMPDLAKIKAEIQAINNEWAMASNAKDIAKI